MGDFPDTIRGAQTPTNEKHPTSEEVSNPPLINLAARLSNQSRSVFGEVFAAINHLLSEHADKAEKAARYYDQCYVRPLTADELDTLWNYIQGDLPDTPKLPFCIFDIYPSVGTKAREILPRLLTLPDFEAVHLVRLCKALGSIRGEHDLPSPLLDAISTLYQRTGHPTLVELGAALESIGIGAHAVNVTFMGYRARTLKKEDVWPFFATQMPFLQELLQKSTGGDCWTYHNHWIHRTDVYYLLSTFPSPPQPLVPILFQLALGSAKGVHPFAQTALASLPDKESVIIDAVRSGTADNRAAAAAWLAKLRCTEAIPVLEKALAKEKTEIAIAAMMDALEALGVPVEKFIDRAALDKEADKGLAKGVPADLEWFPWDTLPTVHWADNGTEVPPRILKWLLVKTCKLKRSAPDPLLRRYCSLIEPHEREVLGQTVLDLWLAHDVKPIPREQAERLARESAKSFHVSQKALPEFWEDSPIFGKTEEEIYHYCLSSKLRLPAGSAIRSRGILALSAACAGHAAAPAVKRYLKQWSVRTTQGRALIAMIAWVEDAAATQLLLSVVNRFRIKSFQNEALRQSELLAERKGWTMAELADRATSTAGFDENGELELDYGERKFIARLTPGFMIDLFNPEGAKISKLPEARKNEDAQLVKEAKKSLSEAKKAIKELPQPLSDRFYEALCAQRTWAFEDWKSYFHAHPIVRHLVRRLVWTVMESGQAVAAFRPLDDGSLTDINDEEITLAPDTRVGIAHDLTLNKEAVAAWQQHLADYEVSPLFPQFGRGSYRLPEERRTETEIADFRGHLLNSFALRNRSAGLGYVRGSLERGEWFYEYHKVFPTLGVQATIRFTGNPVPEENRTVALTHLYFERVGSASRASRMFGQIPLGDLSPVLLSECYNDLTVIAAEGTGFDPDWEKKSEY